MTIKKTEQERNIEATHRHLDYLKHQYRLSLEYADRRMFSDPYGLGNSFSGARGYIYVSSSVSPRELGFVSHDSKIYFWEVTPNLRNLLDTRVDYGFNIPVKLVRYIITGNSLRILLKLQTRTTYTPPYQHLEGINVEVFTDITKAAYGMSKGGYSRENMKKLYETRRVG